MVRTLNIEECAEFLKVHASTAQELAKRGIIPGARIGRAWVFLEDVLDVFLREEIERQTEERKRSNAGLPAQPLMPKNPVTELLEQDNQKRRSRVGRKPRVLPPLSELRATMRQLGIPVPESHDLDTPAETTTALILKRRRRTGRPLRILPELPNK